MKKQRSHCLDCGVDTIKCGHYYMVHDHIWAASGCSPIGGMLCLHCLQRRLGRQLKFEDFTTIVPRAWDGVATRRRKGRRDKKARP